jgi:hypothetical protein
MLLLTAQADDPSVYVACTGQKYHMPGAITRFSPS